MTEEKISFIQKPVTEDKTTISTPLATSRNVELKVGRFSDFWTRKKTTRRSGSFSFNVLGKKLRC